MARSQDMGVAGQTIDASPTKEFFVDMLTRDLTVTDCILDLIDNAMHQVIENDKLDAMRVLEGRQRSKRVRNRRIDIDFSPTRFRIEDTCGGISATRAKREVFRLGRVGNASKARGLGVYGIGMKRAFFKLGALVLMKSRKSSSTFALQFDVDKWKGTESWDLIFSDPDEMTLDFEKRTSGTIIEITKLNAGTRHEFKKTGFNKRLREKIAKTYALFIESGVHVLLNNESIEANRPHIAKSKNLSVSKMEFMHDDVKLLVIAGLAPEPDKTPHGWYIFCNGRMIVEADKTSLTGWGEGFPNFHPKLNHFLGFACFSSNDITSLPWTTTKQGVNREAPVYQWALGEMKLIGRPIVNFLAKMYPGDIEAKGVAERTLLAGAKGVSMERLPSGSHFSAKTGPKRKQNALVNISYTKSRREVDQVKEVIGGKKPSNIEVGKYTFDYFYERNCKT